MSPRVRLAAAAAVAASVAALSASGCDSAPSTAGSGGVSASGVGGAGVGGSAVGGLEPPESYSCSGDDCPPCAQGNGCAEPVDQLAGGTCCGFGDALRHQASAPASEAVHIASDGAVAIVCGGFGATVFDVSAPDAPSLLGTASSRCQRAAIGPTTAAGTMFFLAHHGDSWVAEPSLQVWRAEAGGHGMTALDKMTEPGVLYEGLAFQAGKLYVAAHAGGLRIYDVAPDGKLSLLHVVGGMSNAWQVVLAAGRAYLADFDAGVRVVDISDPATASVIDTVATLGPPRALALEGDRLYVAAGGFGVDVLSRAPDGSLSPLANIATLGTAQAVDAEPDAIVVAAWTHVAAYDPATLRLLATEKLGGYPSFEQDLGVAMVGRDVFVAEWTALHTLRFRPGYIAPDLWITEKLLQFPPTEPTTRAVVVRNLGELPLELDSISTNDPARFSISPDALSIPPHQGDFFEVSFTPPAGPETAVLRLGTNDPDLSDRLWSAGLLAQASPGLGVGDALDADFAFLDPNGQNQLSGVQGKVVVLAYFALF